MNQEQLENAGFRAYKHHGPDTTLFSKTIRDTVSKVTLYFIHATQWTRDDITSVEFSAHFYLPKNNMFGVAESGFIETFVPIVSTEVKDVEAFFQKTYETHGCIPDIHNND